MSNLSAVKFKLIGCLLLFSSTLLTLQAQIRELWRNGVVNEPVGFFYSTTSALDAGDNVIVAGMASFYGGVAPFVVKFDTRGQKLWEYYVGDWRPTNIDVDRVEVDLDGNVFLTWRPRAGTEDAVLIKLSSSGEFLWEYVEESVLEGSFHIVQELVKVNSDGNAYLLAATSVGQRIITKLAPDGAVLWRKPLRASFVDYLGVSDSMVVTPDKGVVIVGGHFVNPPFGNFLGFATKLDKDGNTEWWSDGYKGAEAPYAYSTVSIGPKGNICASGPYHTTTFSEKGKMIQTESQIGGIVLDAGQKGFLVHQDANLQFLNANGNLRWSDSFGYDDIIGAVPRQIGGWVVAGGIPGDLEAIVFSRVDERGKLLWQSVLGGYPYAASWWPRRLSNCFQASDGTLRVVLNLPFSEPGGVAVLSIEIEEPLQ